MTEILVVTYEKGSANDLPRWLGMKTAESVCLEMGKLSIGDVWPGHEWGPPGQKGWTAMPEESPQERGAGRGQMERTGWTLSRRLKQRADMAVLYFSQTHLKIVWGWGIKR